MSADFGGALDQDGTWSYRLTALRRDSDTFVDYVPDDRTYVAPAIKWQPNEATSLTLLAEYQQDRTVYVWPAGAADTSLQYQTRTGIVEHTLLAGLDYSTPKHETRRYFQTLDNLDLYDPVYGSPLGPVTPINSSTKSDTKRLGIYLQDQMKIADKWVVLLGGQDWVRANEHNLFTGEQTRKTKTKAFTGRAGLVYLADTGAVPQLQPVLRADHRPGPPGQPLQTHRRRAIRSRPALPAGGLRHHAVGRRVPADAQEPHRAGPHGHVVPDPGRQGLHAGWSWKRAPASAATPT